MTEEEKAKQKKKKFIDKWASTVFALAIGLTVFLVVCAGQSFQKMIDNGGTLKVSESLLTKQSKLEKTIDSKISKEYTLEDPEVIVDPYGISPLTALVLFDSEEEGVPKITVEGKDNLSTIEGEGELGTKHAIPIYGLYADTANKVTIELNGEKKELTIQTDPLDERVIEADSAYAPDKDKLVNDFYFTTPSSKGLPTGYDVNGDVRWYLTENMTWEISKLANGRLLLGTERTVNPPYYNTGLYEIDFLGKIYNEYSLPGGYHHDYDELENGNLIVATNDFTDFATGTTEDTIVELERETGDIVKTWNLKDVLPQEEGKSENWIQFDWFHNNSVFYDKEHDELILSGRHQDAVVGLDYDSGELKWIMGDSTNWSEEMQKYFFKPVGENFEWQWSQHAAKVTPEGYIFLLDNGNNKSKIKEDYTPAEESYSRGVMYDIDRENMTIEQVWEYGKERGSEFYSPYISDVDYLGANHSLVHSGGTVYVDDKVSNQPAGLGEEASDLVSTTVEVLDDQVIFELTLPTNSYRAEKMSMYDGAASLKTGQAGKLGSLMESKVDNTHEEIGQVVKPDDKYKSFNIDFKVDEDRLTMSGSFVKQGFYELVLVDEDENINGYNFVASARPYTALCVDVFGKKSGTGIPVDKHINKEGLKGKQKIYLRAAGVLYDTGKTVDFGK